MYGLLLSIPLYSALRIENNAFVFLNCFLIIAEHFSQLHIILLSCKKTTAAGFMRALFICQIQENLQSSVKITSYQKFKRYLEKMYSQSV